MIFHVDVNSAFLSWSAAYRVRVLGEQEDLRDIPSAVAGERAERARHHPGQEHPGEKMRREDR